MRLLVRVDAGAGIGFGHLMRCIALVEAAEAAQMSVQVVMRPDPDGLRVAQANSLPIHILPPELPIIEEAPHVAALARTLGADCVTVDVFSPQHEALFPENYLKCLAADGGVPVLAIDDMCSRPLQCAAVLNGNLFAHDLPYARNAPGARLLLGPRYLLQRRAITDLAAEAAGYTPQPGHIVVTFGGSDTARLTLPTLRALRSAGIETPLTVVAGPGMHECEAVAALVARYDGWRLLRNVKDMGRLLLSADLVLCNGGSTIYEAALLRRPMAIVPQTAVERQNAAHMARAGAATVIAPVAAPPTPEGVDEVIQLLHSPQRREAMAAAGGTVVDGKGAQRAVEEIMQLAAGK